MCFTQDDYKRAGVLFEGGVCMHVMFKCGLTMHGTVQCPFRDAHTDR